MTYPDYIRDKAREMRTGWNLSIDEIAERLSLPRTTIYYWMRDFPTIERRGRPAHAGQLKGALANRIKHQALREAAYAEGRTTFDELAQDPSFRDFVCLYIAEGYKRNRNTVSVCNSDPAMVVLCDRWLRRLSSATPAYRVQYHADQDFEELQQFWGAQLGVEPERISLQRKTNSNQLAGRTWRCVHGVLTVHVGDTLLRARLQAWIDRLREAWL